MEELMALQIKFEIAVLESINQRAANDIAMYGQWQCDWNEGMIEQQTAIRNLLQQAQEQPNETD